MPMNFFDLVSSAAMGKSVGAFSRQTTPARADLIASNSLGGTIIEEVRLDNWHRPIPYNKRRSRKQR